MTSSARKLFVASPLPYAYATRHFGHLLQHIQPGIWVRTQPLLRADAHAGGARRTRLRT